MTQPKSHHIDLNDYDLGQKKSGKYACPVCNEYKLSVNTFDGGAFTCYGGCDRLEIRRALKPANETISDELQARREAANQRRIEAERDRVAALKTTNQRNADWVKILAGTPLTPKHQQDMLDRGHTEESIERSGARSMARGRYMPIRDYAGNIVGAQRADKGAKLWYGSTGTNELKETGELPLSVVYPPAAPQFDKKLGGHIYYCESTGDKPWLLAANYGSVTIGSSHPGTQPIDLARTIKGVSAKFGWQKTYHVLMPDGGAIINGGVMANYAKLHQQLKDLGHELMVGWWCQHEKDGGDVDEIDGNTTITHISWEKFLTVSKDYQSYKPLTQLTIAGLLLQKIEGGKTFETTVTSNSGKITIDKLTAISVAAGDSRWSNADNWLAQIGEAQAGNLQVLLAKKECRLIGVDSKFAATTIYSNQWVQPFTPAESTITLISSPCGTGKTEVMKKNITDWFEKHPKARVIDITHMNAIKTGHEDRLGISDWRLDSDNTRGINTLAAISICPDSFLKLDINSIPRNTLLFLDEVEAVLAHMASGGTLGTNLAKVQAHFTAICERVLFGGGAIVAAEDDLTDISIDTLNALVGGVYDLHLIKNEVQQAPWDVSIGTSAVEDFLVEIIMRLANGERVFLPTTSQIFGQKFEQLAIEEVQELTGKTIRLDRKTTADYPDLLADPVTWLTSPDRDIRLFVASPTIQSGFNIALKDFFQCVAMDASNLSTRSINQMLNRVRGNCQRLIRTRKRGCDAKGTARSVPEYEKFIEMRAKEIALSHGLPIVQTAIGDVWNHTAAQFAVRDNLSANHLEEYLRLTLRVKGHNVSEPSWLGSADGDTRIRDRFKEIGHEIKVEDNRTLFEADGKKYTLAQAITVSHSSTVKWLLKQQALKTILEHRARGQFLSEQALWHLYSEDKAKTWGRYEFAYLFHNPAFAKLLDLETLQSQGNQPHILYKDVPTSYQRASLLQEIKDDLMDLASGRDYDKHDPVVERIQKWCLKNSFQAFKYFNINFNKEVLDGHGCVRNTAIANVNKVLKLVGYNGKSTRQVGSKKDRIYIYQVENPDSGERLLVSNAMEIREEEVRDSMSKRDIEAAELLAEVAELKRLDLAEALPYLANYNDLENLAILRAENDPEVVRSATKMLPPDERNAIIGMVLELNRRAA